VAAGLAVLLSAAVSGCGRREESNAVPPSGSMPDQQVERFSLTETVGGKKSWTLYADRADVYSSEGYSDIFGVKIDFYGEDGRVKSVLTAERGRVLEKTKDLEAFGDVRVETSEGVTLEADSLRWDNRASRITSDSYVRLTRGNELLTGYGFDSDPSLSDIRVLRNVKVMRLRRRGASATRDTTKGSVPGGRS